jgi:hypothetical protein
MLGDKGKDKLSLILTLFVFSGCSVMYDGDEYKLKPDAGVATSVEDLFLETFPARFCDYTDRCLGVSWNKERLGGYSDCETFYADAYSYTVDAAGELAVFNEENAADCLAMYDSTDCSVLNGYYICPMAFQGTVPIGGPCGNDLHCDISVAYCSYDGNGDCSPMPVCTARKTPGSDCDTKDKCTVGYECFNGKCTPLGNEGDACYGDMPGCNNSLMCFAFNYDEGTPGTCRNPKDVYVKDVGETCDPMGYRCKSSLACAYYGNETYECIAADPANSTSGSSCQLSYPSQCHRNQYCKDAAGLYTGTCEMLPLTGNPCSSAFGSYGCREKNFCIEGVCKRMGLVGDTCITDEDCLVAEGYCVDGKCSSTNGCHPGL